MSRLGIWGAQEHKHLGEGCDDWQSQEHKWFTSKNKLMRMLALAQSCQQMLAVRATWTYLCLGRFERLKKYDFVGICAWNLSMNCLPSCVWGIQWQEISCKELHLRNYVNGITVRFQGYIANTELVMPTVVTTDGMVFQMSALPYPIQR